MRWPLVKALSRFGTFSGLGEMHSRPGEDGFQSLATYDLLHASYQSPYITLRKVEAADANGNPLQSPDGEESSLINQFDPQGSIPFLFVGGRYVASLTYSPGLLQGLSFQQSLNEAPGILGSALTRLAPFPRQAGASGAASGRARAPGRRCSRDVRGADP